MEISGKRVIVTGGASGLGLGVAKRFAELGARIAIFDLKGAKDAATSLGSGAVGFDLDVTQDAPVAEAMAALAAEGGVHVLVNCAGIGLPGKIFSKKGPMPLAAFENVIAVNLTGTFNTMRLAAEKMAENQPDAGGERGVIVNTSSIAAWEGQMGQVAYSASKSGVLGMTVPVARDLSSLGIRVNAIAPGLFETPMIEGIPEPVMTEIVNGFEFPKRAGTPDEFAQTVQFIVEMSYINAEVIRLDAGTRPPPR